MKHKFGLSLLFAAILPSLGFSLGIRIADQDAEATARGNAFTATADNPSAVYYNPAGMSQLKGQNIQLGGYGIVLGSEFTSTAGARFDTKNKPLGVPQVYYTAEISQSPFTVGLGLYSPYGLGLEWPGDAPFNPLAKSGYITYLCVNPAVAFRFNDQFSIGGGVTINYADADLARGAGFVPGDEFKFRGDGTAVGFNVGALWQPTPQHSFGLNYRTATDVDFTGQSHLTIPGFFAGSSSADAKFHFPQFLAVGYSFRPTPQWNFEFNADWTDWDSLNSVTLNQDALLGGTQLLPYNWTSSWFYEIGATRYFENGYRVSAGYIYSENSVPDASFNPGIPDSDRHIFSVGVGKKYRSLNWNFTYQLAYGPSRSISGTAFGLGDGRYEFLSHALSFSLGYSF
jgi:long-chain fatty acid transport protein